MIWWKKLCWKHTDKIKASMMCINFELKSESDKILLLVAKDFPIGRVVYFDNDWMSIYETKRKLAKEFNKVLNIEARNLLVTHRRSGFNDKKMGVVIKGKHFVTCDWEIELYTHKLTFEEYLMEWGK